MNVCQNIESCASENNKFWVPVRTGDYEKDCEAGRAAAAQMVALMRQDHNPIPFVAAFREAAQTGGLGGFEIGFATEIAWATLRSSSAPLS